MKRIYLLVIILFSSSAFAFIKDPANTYKIKTRKNYFGADEFNLNFDTLDDNNHPKYWQFKSNNQKQFLDSEIKKGGSHSLSISTQNSLDKRPSSLFFQDLHVVVPYNKIKLIGFIKFDANTSGCQFSLIFSAYDGNEGTGQAKLITHTLKNTHEWQKIELVLPISDEITFANITGYLEGKGQVWLDEFYIGYSL